MNHLKGEESTPAAADDALHRAQPRMSPDAAGAPESLPRSNGSGPTRRGRFCFTRARPAVSLAREGTPRARDAISGALRAVLVARPLRPLRGVCGSGIASG